MPTILIVDDEETVLTLLSRILVGAMLSVLTATDTIEARRLLETEEVDVVLSDVYLNGASGLDLLKKIRESSPGLPVILMSGMLTPELTKAAADAGAYDILNKPFKQSELLLTLARAVRQAGRVV